MLSSLNTKYKEKTSLVKPSRQPSQHQQVHDQHNTKKTRFTINKISPIPVFQFLTRIMQSKTVY